MRRCGLSAKVLVTLETMMSDLERGSVDLARLRLKVAAEQHERDGLGNSLSWKVTDPELSCSACHRLLLAAEALVDQDLDNAAWHTQLALTYIRRLQARSDHAPGIHNGTRLK